VRRLEGECAGEFRHDLLNGGQHAFGEDTVIIEDRMTARRHSSDQQLEHVLRGLIKIHVQERERDGIRRVLREVVGHDPAVDDVESIEVF